MKGVLKVIYNIVRGLIRFACFMVLLFFQGTIKLVTYEPGKNKTITVRKAKRIRALSRLKLFVLNAMPSAVNDFLGTERYKIYLNKHLRNGLQLRYK